MAESTEPVALVRRSTRLVSMLFLSQLFGQLCLIHIEEYVQLYYSSRIDCVVKVLNQELLRLFPTLITLFFVPHSLNFASPVGLNFDDPSHFRLQDSVKLNASVVADRRLVLHLGLVCIGAATCRQRLCQLLPHIYFIE